MMVMQYVYLALVVVSVVIYFFSRRKLIIPVAAMLLVFCGFIYSNIAVDVKLNTTVMLISILLLAAVASYHSLHKSNDPGKTYLAFCLVSSLVALPIIVITTVRNEFQFQPDSLWLGMIIVVSLCVWLLLKSNEQERRAVFLITGILLTAIYIAVLFFHPYMYTRLFKMSFLPISIRLNGVYFVYLMLFTLAGYHRLRLLPGTFNHAKLVVPVVILAILSYSTRFPEFSRFLAASPFTEPIPLLLSSFLMLLTPAMAVYVLLTVWFPGTNKRTE